MTSIHQDLEAFEQRLVARLDRIEGRIVSLDGRIDALERSRRRDVLGAKFGRIKRDSKDIKREIGKLQGRLQRVGEGPGAAVAAGDEDKATSIAMATEARIHAGRVGPFRRLAGGE